MKKLIIILFIICLYLTSCKYPIATNNLIIESPYVIVKIEPFKFDKKLCKYYLNTNVLNTIYKDKMTLIDTIGKFDINDSVFICLNKY